MSYLFDGISFSTKCNNNNKMWKFNVLGYQLGIVVIISFYNNVISLGLLGFRVNLLHVCQAMNLTNWHWYKLLFLSITSREATRIYTVDVKIAAAHHRVFHYLAESLEYSLLDTSSPSVVRDDGECSAGKTSNGCFLKDSTVGGGVAEERTRLSIRLKCTTCLVLVKYFPADTWQITTHFSVEVDHKQSNWKTNSK